MNRRVFPRIPWSSWILPKISGGLGIIDSQNQQLDIIQPLDMSSRALTL